jgi:hypothetical protein
MNSILSGLAANRLSGAGCIRCMEGFCGGKKRPMQVACIGTACGEGTAGGFFMLLKTAAESGLPVELFNNLFQVITIVMMITMQFAHDAVF